MWVTSWAIWVPSVATAENAVEALEINQDPSSEFSVIRHFNARTRRFRVA